MVPCTLRKSKIDGVTYIENDDDYYIEKPQLFCKHFSVYYTYVRAKILLKKLSSRIREYTEIVRNIKECHQ